MTMTSTRFSIASIAASVLFVTMVAAPASAGTMQTEGHDFIHRKLAQNSDYDSVVSLNIVGGSNAGTQPVAGTPDMLASGVIVGGRFLLTAAHNVDTASRIYANINGKTIEARRWIVNTNHYNYNYTTVDRNRKSEDYQPFPVMTSRSFEEGHDIAIIELSERIPNARNIKATLNRKVNQANGKTGTIVGYGVTGEGLLGANALSIPGVKRAGQNKIDILNTAQGGQLGIDFDVDPTNPVFSSPLNPKFNSFTGRVEGIDESDVPIAQEYMPAVGDSGGGLFVDGKLAGITSWSTRSDSSYFSQAYFTTIAKHYKWITTNIRALNGRGNFRGNLKVFLDLDNVDIPDPEDPTSTISVPRFAKISDWGAPDFPLIPERAENMASQDYDGTDGANTFGFVFSDPLRSYSPLSYQYPASAVPEPASLALLSLGGLAMLRRTRN